MKKEKKKTILVIEDDKAVLEMIVRHLKSLDYGLMVAEDGMEGLKKLEAGGYDLVITDIVMPYVSGLGIVSTLKKKRPEIPIIAITGYGSEPEDAATEKKADLVLAKPVKMATLKNHISRLLDIKHDE